ncbi:MAG: hypothetical protein ABIR47_13015 [Candidatus Kapaibacterium sp.]
MISNSGTEHHARIAGAARLIVTLILPVMACTILSCGIGVHTRSFFGETLDIRVKVDSVANDELPLAMDVVYVYDENVLAKILQMSSKQWFDQEESRRRSSAENDDEETGYQMWGWEWVPGQDTTVHLPLKSSTVGAVVFVKYFKEGQHRAKLQLFKDVEMNLGYDDFTVEPL